jgi:hypothetical protein
MNAGTLNISVQAEMNALEAQFRDIESRFTDAGKRAMAAFATATAVPAPVPVAPPPAVTNIVKVVKEQVGPEVRREMLRSVEAGVADAAKKSEQAFKKIGTSLGKQTGSALGGALAGQFSDKKIGNMMGAMVGIAVVDRMLDTVADVIRGDKSVGEALNDMISAIPIAGSVVKLGSAISERIIEGITGERAAAATRLSEDAAYMERVMEENAIAIKKREDDEKRLAARKKAYQDEFAANEKILSELEQVSRDRQFENETRMADALAEREAARVRASGDEESALRIEMEREIERERIAMERERDLRVKMMLNSANKDTVSNAQHEMKRFDDAAAERLRVIELEYQERFDLIAAEAEEKKKADEEARQRRIQERDEKIKDIQDEARKEISAAISATRAVQSGAIQAVGGTFKFNAFGDMGRKRNVDEDSFRTLTKILEVLGKQYDATMNMAIQ